MRAGLPTSVAGHERRPPVRLGPDGHRHRGQADHARRDDRSSSAAGWSSISLVQNANMNLFRCQDPWLVEHLPALYMSMLETAEVVAERYGISREAQDEYALQSQQRTAQAQAEGRFDAEIAPMTTRMKVVDKATGDRLRPRGHPDQGRGQPPADHARGPRQAAAGVRRRHADQAGPVHHRRQRLAAVGRRLGLGADGGQGRREARPRRRSAPIAAWPWPAAIRTRWASARSSPCPSCSSATA